jgi:hypothetical protein
MGNIHLEEKERMKRRRSSSERRVHREAEERRRSGQEVIGVVQRIASIQVGLNKKAVTKMTKSWSIMRGGEEVSNCGNK